jgi:hypothetical protein
MRKRTTTKKGIFAPQNRKFLIAGVAAAAIGTWLLAGDKIKSLLKSEEKDPIVPPIAPAPAPAPAPLIAPAPAPTGGGGGGKSEPAGLDINKVLRKGTQGEEVKRLQFIINYIAGFRNSSSYKTPGGYTVKFPIGTDGDFGNGTQAGAYFIAPSFKSDGFITLDTARKRLAYIAGYYGKPFPSELVGTKNYNTYQSEYKSGQIDFGKDDRAKKIGTFVNPFNP